ncbi:carboxylic ester hydrolase [Sphaerisporangium rufum]|uniref:Carboxylic ester hydrolase n=1 Tax=Sphaerisporangium rufum TaxID=1381558 RepID=A0A919QY64_9ACTN|nr:carboxylesterase family protein [Sphaerisporangium rufum]GII76249.1 carboxylic ester hydrolase [Sphaerisporangium rufum]
MPSAIAAAVAATVAALTLAAAPGAVPSAAVPSAAAPSRAAPVARTAASPVWSATAPGGVVPAGARPAGECAARTSLGAVAGTARGGVCAFRGIPYAQAPVGALRFRPPRPARPWRGTLRAVDGTRVCPQFRDDVSEEYPDARPVYTDEDCLYLNVWTPSPDRRARRPVIVFIHGGAARFGGANEPRYDGTALAARGDAVVVTLNYRLGAFGWAELGHLDPAYRGSGNNGLRDQMAALRWVRRQARAFGGDPGRITVAGESEGAISISAMLATDHPERLFRRAVLQSGSGALVHSAALERRLAPALPVRSVAELAALPAARVLELQEQAVATVPGAAGGALYFGPYIDGTLVRGPVTERVEAGHARHVELLVGSNRDEVNYFAQFTPGGLPALAAQYDALFPAALADRREEMTKVYRAGRSEQQAALAMFTDQMVRVPATRLADAQSRWRRTFTYRFDWAPSGGLGAVHTAELPFVFGSLRFTGIPGGADALRADPAGLGRLSGRMMDAWTSFARTGDPGAGGAAPWPAYSVPRRATKIWDLAPRTEDDPAGAERALWDAIPFDALDL